MRDRLRPHGSFSSSGRRATRSREGPIGASGCSVEVAHNRRARTRHESLYARVLAFASDSSKKIHAHRACKLELLAAVSGRTRVVVIVREGLLTLSTARARLPRIAACARRFFDRCARGDHDAHGRRYATTRKWFWPAHRCEGISAFTENSKAACRALVLQSWAGHDPSRQLRRMRLAA